MLPKRKMNMFNATTINGRQHITSVDQIEEIAKNLPKGFHTVAVFDYRCAVSRNNITLPEDAFNQKKLCEKIGAQFDNHQVIVCVGVGPFYGNKWLIVCFSDHLAFVTDDLDNLEIDRNPW